MSIKDKLPLVVGIGLPIFLILYILATVYLPSLYLHPQYNFIYAAGCMDDYTVQVIDGKVTAYPKYTYDNTYQTDNPACFYLYNVHTDSSKPLTLAEADVYTLDSSSKSLDGYVVEQGDSSPGVFPFFWYNGDTSGYYLSGHGLHKKVSGSYNFQFLGWIK